MDHIEQQYLPWNPVPESANHAFALGVGAFISQMYKSQGQVSVMAFAPKPGPPTAGYIGLDWWRIRFANVRAFRFGVLDRLPVDAGAWEVAPSRWMAEMSEDLPYHLRESMHHYVISDETEVYELLATGWSSEPLPAGWHEDVRSDLGGA